MFNSAETSGEGVASVFDSPGSPVFSGSSEVGGEEDVVDEKSSILNPSFDLTTTGTYLT